MPKNSVPLVNKVDFQQFLDKYVIDGETKKGAFWEGKVRTTYFRISQLKLTQNIGRPEIVGYYLDDSMIISMGLPRMLGMIALR